MKRLSTRRVLLAAAALALMVGTIVTTVLLLDNPAQYMSSSLAQKYTYDTYDTPLAPATPQIRYGMVLDSFEVVDSVVHQNQFLSDILGGHGVSMQTMHTLMQKSKSVFDLRKIRTGKPYSILKNAKTQEAEYFIYEPSVFRYIVFDLRDTLRVEEIRREVEVRTRVGMGVVKSSLWNAMVDGGMSYALAAKMEDALAWSVDFHHLYPRDSFRLIFEEKYIQGQPVGVSRLKAAYFRHGKKENYAFWYEDESGEIKGYYDEEARPQKQAFLKAPVKYTRIASRYNLNRFHPVLKRVRPHKGTDYAAPHGTPIYAVADGIVSRAARGRGNGIFVKIKHDKTYSTQYLHMSRHAKGMHVGKQVRQGEIIGYVGSTGLSTGPHVCFRFWKNGKQVDHLRENLPNKAEPLPEATRAHFMVYKDSLKTLLEQPIGVVSRP